MHDFVFGLELQRWTLVRLNIESRNGRIKYSRIYKYMSYVKTTVVVF